LIHPFICFVTGDAISGIRSRRFSSVHGNNSDIVSNKGIIGIGCECIIVIGRAGVVIVVDAICGCTVVRMLSFLAKQSIPYQCSTHAIEYSWK
jgi:hypothetical protein